MPKPTRYYVDYEDPKLIARAKRRESEGKYTDFADVMTWEDFESLDAARAFQQAQNADKRYACIRERTNIIDETPPWDIAAGVPAWTLWDSEDEVIEDSR